MMDQEDLQEDHPQERWVPQDIRRMSIMNIKPWTESHMTQDQPHPHSGHQHKLPPQLPDPAQ